MRGGAPPHVTGNEHSRRRCGRERREVAGHRAAEAGGGRAGAHDGRHRDRTAGEAPSSCRLPAGRVPGVPRSSSSQLAVGGRQSNSSVKIMRTGKDYAAGLSKRRSWADAAPNSGKAMPDRRGCPWPCCCWTTPSRADRTAPQLKRWHTHFGTCDAPACTRF